MDTKHPNPEEPERSTNNPKPSTSTSVKEEKTSVQRLEEPRACTETSDPGSPKLPDPTPPSEHTTVKKREARSTLFHERDADSLIRTPPGNPHLILASAQKEKKLTNRKPPSSTPPADTQHG